MIIKGMYSVIKLLKILLMKFHDFINEDLLYDDE